MKIRTLLSILLLCVILSACELSAAGENNNRDAEEITSSEGQSAKSSNILNYKAMGENVKYEYVDAGSYQILLTRLYSVNKDAFLEFELVNKTDRDISVVQTLQHVMEQDGNPVVLVDNLNRLVEEVSWKDVTVPAQGSKFLYAFGKVEPEKPITLRFSFKDQAETVEYQFTPDPKHEERFMKKNIAVDQTVLLFGEYKILAETGSIHDSGCSTVLSILRSNGSSDDLQGAWNITLRKGDEIVPVKNVVKVLENNETLEKWFSGHRVEIGDKDVADRYRFDFEAFPNAGEEWHLSIIDKMLPSESIVIPYNIQATPFDSTGI